MNTPSTPSPSALDIRRLWLPVVAMIGVIVLSNWAVQFPINDWLTWGAFTYPVVFLVTDLTNRALGPKSARMVAWIGFPIAVGLSIWLADYRIAIASGSAFLASQMLDIAVFNHWRRQAWWKAPLLGSAIGSVLDTAIFFFIAFFGVSDVNWLQLAAGDLATKWLMAAVLLAPYRMVLPLLKPWMPATPVSTPR